MLTRIAQMLLVACVSLLIVTAFTCQEDPPTPTLEPTVTPTATSVPTVTPNPIFATLEAQRTPTATPTATPNICERTGLQFTEVKFDAGKKTEKSSCD